MTAKTTTMKTEVLLEIARSINKMARHEARQGNIDRALEISNFYDQILLAIRDDSDEKQWETNFEMEANEEVAENSHLN